MSAKVHNIDHPVWAVRDLQQAHRQFQRLGFVVPPIGLHQQWGTGNICIMFATDYLEIRGIANPDRYLAGLPEFLADGEGLIGVAFGMKSADASHEAALAVGLKVTEPRPLHRKLVLEDKTLDLHFRNVMMEPEDHPGFSHANLCQHLTPDELRQPGWLDHPNSAVSVSSIVGVVDDLEDARRRYEVLLGQDAVTHEGSHLALRFPEGAVAELILPQEARARGIDQPARGKHYMAALGIQVRSFAVLESYLSSQGISFHRDGSIIHVNPDDACGAPLSFVEVPNG